MAKSFHIIPVIDIKDGKVVQAIGGFRDRYFPVSESQLVESSNPLVVMQSFIQKFDFRRFYIADLNSIQQKGDNYTILKILKESFNVELMVDIGIRVCKDFNKNVIDHIDCIILGTETICSLEVVRRALELKGKEKVIASIDIKNGQLLTQIDNITTPLSAVKILYKRGIKNFIILHFDKIGKLQGPSNKSSLLIEYLQSLQATVFVGGGVRSIENMRALRMQGVRGVLVGTAFHKNLIQRKDVCFIQQL